MPTYIPSFRSASYSFVTSYGDHCRLKHITSLGLILRLLFLGEIGSLILLLEAQIKISCGELLQCVISREDGRREDYLEFRDPR